MSPVAHSGLGLLGWHLFDRKKTLSTLALYVIVANWADVDFLLYAIFKGHVLFVHQYFTHNLLFVLVASFLFSLLIPRGGGRAGLVLTGVSHLAVDLIVVDTMPPVGIRMLFPFENSFFNLPWFPYLRRGTWEVMTSTSNLLVLGLEFALFVLPVLVVFRRSLWKRWTDGRFWKV